MIDGQQVFTRGSSPGIPYTLFTVDVGARAGPGPHTLSFRRTAAGAASNDYFLVDDISLDAANGAPVVLSTQATGSVTIGQQISDAATITGGNLPGGTLTFRTWLNPSCTGPPDYTSNPVPVSGAGTYKPSPAFIPAAVGTYHWIASYSGDANNIAVSGACNDPGENSVVNNPTPALTTLATASVTIGQQISDAATITGGNSPGGSVSFKAWLDPSCAGPPDYTSNPVPVDGAGTYNSSPTFIPAAIGTYHWIATYSGDANDNPTAGACNDPGEASIWPPRSLPVPSNVFTIEEGRDEAERRCRFGRSRRRQRRECRQEGEEAVAETVERQRRSREGRRPAEADPAREEDAEAQGQAQGRREGDLHPDRRGRRHPDQDAEAEGK